MSALMGGKKAAGPGDTGLVPGPGPGPGLGPGPGPDVTDDGEDAIMSWTEHR